MVVQFEEYIDPCFLKNISNTLRIAQFPKGENLPKNVDLLIRPKSS
jgi:hypothetical protein